MFVYITRLELSSICTSYDPGQGPTDAPERPSGASISLHRAEKGRQGFYIFGSDMMWHLKFEKLCLISISSLFMNVSWQ